MLRGIAKLIGHSRQNPLMNTYKRHRHPPVIFSYAVWLYYRFNFICPLAYLSLNALNAA